MSESAFQSELARLVVDPDFRDRVRERGEAALREDLSELERVRLVAIAKDPGIDVTRTLHKGFRLAKLLAWVPLTCAVIPRDVLAREVGNFWQQRPPVSFYFLEEAAAFCEYLLERVSSGLDVPYLVEVAAYERASLELQRARPAGEVALPQVVDFLHDPEVLLASLARREVPPELPEQACRLIGVRTEGGV
ncbi:MAG TPA: hypothetical protein VE078_15925, partial [Thermoanaerobaculia bacterium]|nr:hypothetical protein [Thermoanaerobaculia bacterium]